MYIHNLKSTCVLKLHHSTCRNKIPKNVVYTYNVCYHLNKKNIPIHMQCVNFAKIYKICLKNIRDLMKKYQIHILIYITFFNIIKIYVIGNCFYRKLESLQPK